MLDDIIAALHTGINPKGDSQRYFKTGKGDYAENEKFLNIPMPAQRRVAKTFSHAPFSVISALLRCDYHEHRLTALLILVYKFEKGDTREKEEVVEYYLSHLEAVDSWDLVDATAAYILGPWFFSRDRTVLHELFASSDLWRRRVALLSNWYFIRHQDFSDILSYVPDLILDSRDLTQKAAGWMLREMGRRNPSLLYQTLDSHASRMPRTMLRSAIRGLLEKDRQHYLKLY